MESLTPALILPLPAPSRNGLAKLISRSKFRVPFKPSILPLRFSIRRKPLYISFDIVLTISSSRRPRNSTQGLKQARRTAVLGAPRITFRMSKRNQGYGDNQEPISSVFKRRKLEHKDSQG